MTAESRPSLEALPIGSLKGVGPALEARLTKLGLARVQDLLFHLPLRYQDRTRIRPLGSLRAGDEAAFEGRVVQVAVEMGRRRSLACRIEDGSGALTLRFYHFSAAQQRALPPGSRLRAYGALRNGRSGLEVYHPEYQRLAQAEVPLESQLTPIYPATEGLTQTRLRSLCEQALALLERGALVDWLPADQRRAQGLMPLDGAVRFLHQPPPEADLALLAEGRHPAQRRLALEELLAHHLSLQRLRRQQQHLGAPALRASGRLARRLRQQLPFALTGAQERVVAEIGQDLSQPVPMLRLVQGDVGSGKTLVAAMAALQAVDAGHQVALMAPTELLAEQHLDNFSHWLAPLGIAVEWLAGRLKGRRREEALARIREGQAQLVVGTQALFQEDVAFADLGLVVVDEQHRFGVHQRLALREKGRQDGRLPHQLIMTATPIPRTLTMSAYADLDCSLIDELPPGRRPVDTVLVSQQRRKEVIERVRAACGQGCQAYWVCTLIEESEALECQAAEATAEALTRLLPELRVALVHGRMKSSDKAAIMEAFKARSFDLLVATTVIEVGVDVPNASLMVIENPERLGLAQLHQLRGRVGRGHQASYCVLLYQQPLGRQSRERLQVMRATTDGFAIAQRDLEIRGPGEVLGTRQTGLMQLRVADLERDADLLDQARRLAARLKPSEAAEEALVRRWLGSGMAYAGV